MVDKLTGDDGPEASTWPVTAVEQMGLETWYTGNSGGFGLYPGWGGHVTGLQALRRLGLKGAQLRSRPEGSGS